MYPALLCFVLSIYLCINLSIHPSIYPIYLAIYPSIHLSINVHVCIDRYTHFHTYIPVYVYIIGLSISQRHELTSLVHHLLPDWPEGIRRIRPSDVSWYAVLENSRTFPNGCLVDQKGSKSTSPPAGMNFLLLSNTPSFFGQACLLFLRPPDVAKLCTFLFISSTLNLECSSFRQMSSRFHFSY